MTYTLVFRDGPHAREERQWHDAPAYWYFGVQTPIALLPLQSPDGPGPNELVLDSYRRTGVFERYATYDYCWPDREEERARWAYGSGPGTLAGTDDL